MKLHKGFELNCRRPWRHTCCSIEENSWA